MRNRLNAQTGFGIVTYRPGGKYGPRLQEPFQLLVIHNGSMHLTDDAGEQTLQKGEGILLVPGRMLHLQFSRDSETTHSWCQIPQRLMPAYFSFPAQCMGRAAPCSKWLLDIMKVCGRLPPKYAAGESLHVQVAAVLQVMWHFCAVGFQADSTQPPEPEPLLRVSRLITTRLAESLTLADMATAAAVSIGHLGKLAREHWKTTPMEKLWLMRVEEAARLLSQTGLGVAEVAYRTGFANPFHFSRRFKARFGQHPQAWQRSTWQPK